MCGILGWISAPGGHVDSSTLARAALALEHRGPDDSGFLGHTPGGPLVATRDADHTNGHRVGLAHRRLSILDLTTCGWQPMLTADGRYAIVYNGEIYNFLELREELARQGSEFRSRSDTEVLLQALSHWGLPALTRLTGMFAFALLDRERGRMILARDPFGIKPLFYASGAFGFAFASEIKALLELPGISRQANPARLRRFLLSGTSDEGEETMFAGIHQVPPAHWMEVRIEDARHLAPVRYWHPRPEPGYRGTFSQAAEELRASFLDSVRLHLRSDVPLGAALSGGIDSSAIVGAVRLLEPKAELHTFSFVADDPVLSEERWARMAADASRVTMHVTTPAADELVRDLDSLIASQDEPFGSTSIYAQHRVFRLAREAGITVMLDGQGADELLAGYSTFIGIRVAQLLRSGQWREATSFIRQVSSLPHVRASALAADTVNQVLPQWLRPLARRAFQSGSGLSPSWLDDDWFASRGSAYEPALRRPDARTLLNARLADSVELGLPSLLRYEDRNSMHFSIESRVPFLTTPLAEFLLALPPEFLLDNAGTSKSVFRAAMRGIVPDAVLDRRDKVGFVTPERRWLSTLTPWVESVLGSDAAHAIPPLRLPQMRQDWANVLGGRTPFSWRVWRWINVIRWAELRGVEFS